MASRLIADDPEQWLQALTNDWDRFAEVANRPGASHQHFREINRTLGYNLAKAVPALILRIKQHQTRISALYATNQELKARATEAESQVEDTLGKYHKDLQKIGEIQEATDATELTEVPEVPEPSASSDQETSTNKKLRSK